MWQIIGTLNLAYPTTKYETTEQMIDLWIGLLGHYEIETLKLAVLQTISKSKFPPTIADINDGMRSLLGAGLPTAGEAWAMADDAKDYRTFDDYSACDHHVPEIVARAVQQLGGWEILLTNGKRDFIRGQFMDIYEGLRAQKIESSIASPEFHKAAKQILSPERKAITGENGKSKLGNSEVAELAAGWKVKQ